MGKPRSRGKTSELREWVRANLEAGIATSSSPAWVSFVAVQRGESFTRFLVAVRDTGKDVFRARRVTFALVRDSRAGIRQEKRTPLLHKERCDAETWNNRLVSALRQLELDPACLEQLSRALQKEDGDADVDT